MTANSKVLRYSAQLPISFQTPRHHYVHWPDVLWWLLLGAATFPIVFRQVTVSDVWWHIAIGDWLVWRQTAPELSQFYSTPFETTTLLSELRWQWLGDIILCLLHSLMGSLGLQILPFFCFLLAAFIVSRIWSARLGPFMILLLVIACIGTYQLQLPRNSVFSLALYPAILALCAKRDSAPKANELLGTSALLLAWSFLHGSCLLGWASACLGFGARVASSRTGKDNSTRSLVVGTIRFAFFAIGTLLLISYGRDDSLLLLQQPILHSNVLAQTTHREPLENSTAESSASTTIGNQIKDWLNSTIWRKDSSVPWSNDYWSPFDMPAGNRPVEAACLLAASAAGCVVFSRKIPLGLTLAWGASCFLGFGYVRMFGYTALASTIIITTAAKNAHCCLGQPQWLRSVGWIAVIFWIGVAWHLFFAQRFEHFIPDGQHVSRTGKAAIYDDAAARWLKDNYPQEKAFTTIETGSYCLQVWNFQKQVYIDGFFAPHTKQVWQTYAAALSGDLSALSALGASTAILPNTATKWIDAFLSSPEWVPVAIGSGNTIFVQKDLPLPKSPEILCSAVDLNQTSVHCRRATIWTLLQIVARAPSSPRGFTADQWVANARFSDFSALIRDTATKLD